MLLRYAPTLVIGLDDGNKMPELIKQVWFWLSEMQPQVLPIVSLGIANEKYLAGINDNSTKSEIADGLNLAEGLNLLLNEISEAENLQKVRDAGFDLPPNLLVRRILVAVDSQTDWQRTKAVLDTLVQILQQRGEAAVNLLVAVLTQSEDTQLPKGFDELKNWLTQSAQNFRAVQLLVLDRYRSDGSTINPAQLPLVLTFLLLTALTPYESDEHWLFSGTFGKPFVRTAGLGIIYVPLPDIADAAAKWLCYQLSPQALKEQVDEVFLNQRWQEMQDALDETNLWRGIFRNLSDYGIGAKVDNGDFAVNLPEGLIRLDLSAIPWDKWSERISDWEAKWMLMLKEFWLPMVKEGANKTQQETAQKLEQALSKCVANGVAIKTTVERLMAKVQEWLIDWKSKKAPKGVKTIQVELQKLDEAIRRVPNPYAIAARVFLIGTVTAYLTFVLARWSWLSGFIANWLRNFLPFVEAWMIPALIGVLGLFAILRLIWNGWKAYDEAVNRVEDIKENCIQALAEEIASFLREAGLQALEQFNQQFNEWAKRTNESNRIVAENIETQRQEWEATFKSFHASDYPLVRSCIKEWGQLEPIFEEAMRGRPYDELWRQLLKDAELVSWEQWLNRWLDRSAAKTLEQAARNLWRNQLEGEKVKQLSTYLKDDARSQRLLEDCYTEASKLLWRQVKSGTQWRWALKPEGENNLAGMSEEILRQRYGNIRDWQSLALPSIIGYLQVAEV